MPTVCLTEHETTLLHRENHGLIAAVPACGTIDAMLVRRFVQARMHLRRTLVLQLARGLVLVRGLLPARVLVSLLAIGLLLALMIAQVFLLTSVLVPGQIGLLVLAQ